MDTNRDIGIAIRAYHLWKNEGCPDGKALDHWLTAEATALGETRLPAAIAAAPAMKPARRKRATTRK
ncbi:MAG: DUF2934 domain-containing protein [Stellaceae bacterium]